MYCALPPLLKRISKRQAYCVLHTILRGIGSLRVGIMRLEALNRYSTSVRSSECTLVCGRARGTGMSHILAFPRLMYDWEVRMNKGLSLGDRSTKSTIDVVS